MTQQMFRASSYVANLCKKVYLSGLKRHFIWGTIWAVYFFIRCLCLPITLTPRPIYLPPMFVRSRDRFLKHTTSKTTQPQPRPPSLSSSRWEEEEGLLSASAASVASYKCVFLSSARRESRKIVKNHHHFIPIIHQDSLYLSFSPTLTG